MRSLPRFSASSSSPYWTTPPTGATGKGTRSSLRLLRVTEHAEVIAQARELALECVRRDPQANTPGFADAIRFTERLASGDWLDSA